MVIIPDRLFQEPFVDLYHRSSHLILMHKFIDQRVDNRQSYVAKHAISIVVKGTQRIQMQDGPMIIIPAGNMGFIRKGVYSVTDMLSDDQGFESYHIFFDDLFLEHLLSDLSVHFTLAEPDQVFLKKAMPSVLPAFLAQIAQIHQWKPQGKDKLMEMKAKEFFMMLMMEDDDHQLAGFLHGLKERHVRNLLQFMRSHFDKPLTIEDYASLTGRSISTFRREFKAKFGVAPRKWITQQRMEKARELVTHSQLNVTDIAAAVGYENISHFISEFKKHFGHTPTQLGRVGNRL